MHRREVPVRSPCKRSIADMTRVDEGVRWCPSCEHEVHDLSELDEAQARAVLRAHRGRSLCVRYATDSDGRVLSADRLTRRPRLAGFALAATVSLVLLTGCASTSTSQQTSAAPIPSTDPWHLTVDFEVDPEQDIIMGMVVLIEEDRFIDPLLFELEDAIIPESISRSRR